MSELPRGWVEATIGEVCSYIQRGKSPKYTEKSDLPIINQKCVRWWGIDERYLKFIDPEQWPSWTDERFLTSGDVLWNSTGTGTIGRAALFRRLSSADRVVVDSHVTILRPGGAVSGAFLHRFIQSPSVQNAIADMQSGTTNQVELNRTEIIGTALPLPPLAEQKRIVTKLDALNARSTRARTELARIETLVSRYKQAVLRKAFSGELTREWRTHLKATEPRIGKLEELLSVPVRNGLSVKGSDTPPGFPALRLSALREREVRLDDVRYIPVDDDKARRFLLETGDILVSRGNGTRSLVGIASLVPTVFRPTIFPDTAFRIRVDSAKALPLWLTSLWNAPQVRSQIELVAKTTAGIWKISQKDLATIQLSLPSTLAEQHEIVRRIESAFAKIDRLAGQAKRALELVGRLDEAILAKAFRGELVPQDEGDEPASSLLERIKQARMSQPAKTKRKAPKRQGKVPYMARTIVETLVQAKDWLDAQELFERCGVRDGSSTEDVEKLYTQLLELERQEKVEIEEVVNPSTGAKQGDRVRLRK